MDASCEVTNSDATLWTLYSILLLLLRNPNGNKGHCVKEKKEKK